MIGTRIPVSFLQSTKVQTETEDGPNLNTHLMMIMAVIRMMETIMIMTVTLRALAYINQGEDYEMFIKSF